MSSMIAQSKARSRLGHFDETQLLRDDNPGPIRPGPAPPAFVAPRPGPAPLLLRSMSIPAPIIAAGAGSRKAPSDAAEAEQRPAPRTAALGPQEHRPPGSRPPEAGESPGRGEAAARLGEEQQRRGAPAAGAGGRASSSSPLSAGRPGWASPQSLRRADLLSLTPSRRRFVAALPAGARAPRSVSQQR